MGAFHLILREKNHKQKNCWDFSGFHFQLETGGPRQLASVLEYNWSRSRTPGPGSVSSCLQTASGKGGKKPQWCVVHRRVGPPSSPRQLSDRSSFFFIAGLPDTSTQGRCLLCPLSSGAGHVGLTFSDFHWLSKSESESVALFPRDFWSN